MLTSYLAISMLTMAAVTYAIRVVPILLFKKKFKNTFLNSFLFYTPYTVLAALVFPAILTSTDQWISSLIGTAVALGLSFLSGKLLVVAGGSVLAVYVTEWILSLL